MEQATLRPVPLRPAGPVDPGEALAHVLAALPELDEDAARALALIEIAGRTRAQATDETGHDPVFLRSALYRARKALRRSMFPLSASGWCERAEMLLSERIDGVLLPPGPARLDVHLRNCDRCVEHERRLSQAREKLVREFIDAHPEAAGAGPAERPVAATLRVVEPATIAEAEPEPHYDGPTRTVPGFAGPTLEPLAADATELPAPSFAGPGGQVEIVVEPPRATELPEPPQATETPEPDPAPAPQPPQATETPEPDPAPAPQPPTPPDVHDEVEGDPTIEQDVAPAEPADATPSEDDAEKADPPVDESAPEASEPVVEAAPDASASHHPVAAEAAVPQEAIAAIVPTVTAGSVVWGALSLVSVGLAAFALVVLILALSGIDRIL